MATIDQNLRAAIRDIPDFPKPGIMFKDISPLLADPKLFRATIDRFAERWAGEHIDVVVGMESRGFLFGAPLAMELSAAFVPARKPGKLPYKTVSVSYDLEYGSNTLEMHTDAIQPGQKVLIVDDLLATGGTAKATRELVEKLGGEVAAFLFVVELAFLDGRAVLGDSRVESLVSYD
jgi:adenine phosphoribosyltransferase